MKQIKTSVHKHRDYIIIPAAIIRLSALLFFFPFFLLLTGCGQMPSGGDTEEGKRWFGLHRCNGCHGEQGLGGRAPVIFRTNWSYKKFTGKIRNSKSSIMPSYSKETIPDEDIADIYVYLQQEK